MRKALIALLFCLPVIPWRPCYCAEVEVYFSPRGGCEAALVHEIDAATTSIYCQYYGFTSSAVGEALARAAKRGADVEILVDRSNEFATRSQAADCKRAGCKVLTDKSHPIAHNKIAIIDMHEVVGGSFNPSDQAEHSNAENLTIIRDRDIARQFFDNWQAHQAHCMPFHPAPPRAAGKRPLSKK